MELIDDLKAIEQISKIIRAQFGEEATSASKCDDIPLSAYCFSADRLSNFGGLDSFEKLAAILFSIAKNKAMHLRAKSLPIRQDVLEVDDSADATFASDTQAFLDNLLGAHQHIVDFVKFEPKRMSVITMKLSGKNTREIAAALSMRTWHVERKSRKYEEWLSDFFEVNPSDLQ
jgi:hypothetical protein